VPKTIDQYHTSLQNCKDVFVKKHMDYGSAWRILRLTSLTDQMYIKASRIRSIEQTGKNKVGESIKGEFEALVNYGIMANIQIRLGGPAEVNMDISELMVLYDEIATSAHDLMMDKNHDYGEAWRDMRISSMTDLILVKLLRIKQIEDNEGKTSVSEGIDANYLDIINYALFALIKISEEENITL
jgi:hypothetical protein